MASGNAIRGTRLGGGPERPTERAEPAPRKPVTYWCGNAHRFEILLAVEADVPATWDCPRCGQQAGPDAQNPPGRNRAEPYKTHLAYVKERRTEAEGQAILAEALAALRQRRGRG